MPDRRDNRPDVQVAAIAADEWSVLSLAELQACGLSRDAVWRRVHAGRLHPLYREVYAVGHPNVPLEGRFLAAVKACGDGAVLSHYSAAALWGIVDWDERDPEVTLRDTTPRVHAGIRAHRTLYLEPKDVRRLKGIPTTSPARTVLDLANQLRYLALRRAVRHALSVHLLSIRDLVEILARLGKRRGAAKLQRIIAGGPAPTRSVLEDVVLDVILAAGLGRPDVNVPIVLDGRRVIPDFRWPEQHLVVEADSAAWHDSKLAREDDAERQALLEAHSERVVRITWDQAIAHRRQTIARLRSASRVPA